MKRVYSVAVLLLACRLVGAQGVDFEKFIGENWYGLYLNGQKSGFLMSSFARENDGTIVVVEDAQFKLMMAGIKQDIRILSRREYSSEGEFLRFTQEVMDAKGLSRFEGVVRNGMLNMVSTVADVSKADSFPAPKENLRDALKQSTLAGPNAHVGDTITYSYFEPMVPGELEGRSEIIGEETRIFEGAPTKVFKIQTRLEYMNIETISYVTEDGTLLEDITAGMITMRLEPKEVAQDVDYVNDVLVANAAYVDEAIPNPRTRSELRLMLKGPLSSAHLFNDERQVLIQKGDVFEFTGRAISMQGFEPAQLPITEPSVSEWMKPTRFVQSDDPKIVAKAKEIVGDEKNSMKIVEKLCAWVYQNVDTTFSARLSNALEVLNSLEGDCTEHSILFIALARGAGLPAREAAGLIYMDGDRPGFYFHQWAKVWVGKWIDVDPTWNQPLADVTHIKLGEGDLFQQAQLIPVVGHIKVDVLDATAAH